MGALVSVIMSTYNSGESAAGSIGSILGQTYGDLELLVTDDGSTDPATLQLLSDMAKQDGRIRVFFQKENLGPGCARNNSIREARGRYIAFCDSDDRWEPNKLERQIRFMNENHVALSYTSYLRVKPSGEKVAIVIAPERMTFGKLQMDNKIGLSTAIYDIELLGRKYYMPLLRKRQDWGLMLTILRDCHFALGLREPLTLYMVRKGSVSRNKMSLIKYNLAIYEQVLGFSKVKSVLKFCFVFMPNYIFKRLKTRWDSRKYLAD